MLLRASDSLSSCSQSSDQGLSYYQAVFGRVLSCRTLSSQFSEGFAALHFEWSYLNWWLLLALMAGVLLKWWLLRRASHATVAWRRRLTLGAVSLLAYFLLLAVAMWRIDRPENCAPSRVPTDLA